MAYVRRSATGISTDVTAILEDTSTTLDNLVDDLETRLTAARAGYLDNLSGGAVALAASVGTLANTGGTATLGGILGDVANSSVAARLTALAGYVDDLETRLTAARAGYLDNLSGGAVALASSVGTLVNSGGTATIGAILGDFANTTIAGKFLLLNDHIGPSYNNTRYLAVTADLSSETWNTVATHEVFTVTGTVRMRMWITCGTTLEDAADAAIISFGTESDTDKLIGATDAAGLNGQTLTAGQLWYDTSPVDGPDTFANAVLDYVVPNGLDLGYEITGEALTAGALVFHCVWEPLDATGAVAAGAGGAMV